MSVLEVKEGIQEQSADEKVAYQITTTNYGSNPTSPTAAVYDETDGDTDVTSTVMPSAGSHSVSGDVITLKQLTALTRGHIYRVEVKFTISSNILECFFRVKCVI